jgi:abortive infection bacteriophage resistance protein
MDLKKALNSSEQLLLLRERGLKFEAVELSETFLRDNNYYRLNYYFKKCREGLETFTTVCHFEEIIDIYEFDKWMRISLLSILEPIEIKIRSNIAYNLGLKYGPGCFYNKGLFDLYFYTKIESAFAAELDKNRNLSFVIHHLNNYDGKFPIWVIVELFTFGQLSKFYSALQSEDKEMLSTDLYNLDSKYLKNWLHALSLLRNICAHYGPLYRKEFVSPPLLGNLFGPNVGKNNSLFGMLLVIKRLSDTDRWELFIQQLSDFNEKQNSVSLSDYGFPLNWKTILM